MSRLLPILALLLSMLAFAPASRAAECIEFGVPAAIITDPGTYCLSANLTANMSASGNMITIAANDVVLDCRGYTLRNTYTGFTGSAYAIFLSNRKNVQVRNCHIAGRFQAGIYAYQDNAQPNQNRYLRFNDNVISETAQFGIIAYGSNIEILDNSIQDVGGRNSFAIGIRVTGSTVAGQPRHFDVRGNTIVGTRSPTTNAYGILGDNPIRSIFAGNEISLTDSPDSAFAYGIKLANGVWNKIADNHIVGNGGATERGIETASANDDCYHNHIRVYYGYATCDGSLGNY